MTEVTELPKTSLNEGLPSQTPTNVEPRVATLPDVRPQQELGSTLTVDQQIATANAIDKQWGSEQTYVETVEAEIQQLTDLLGALQRGEITEAEFVATTARRIGERVVSGEKDPRTGLDNYIGGSRKTRKELARSLRNQTPTTFLMIDLDNFKPTNDTLGHEAGNHALNAAGQHISSAVRDYDIPFRYGGDEFAITLPNSKVDDIAKTIGTRLVDEAPQTIREIMEANNMQIPMDITFSIGAAEDIPPNDPLSPDLDIEEREAMLFDLADKAALVSKFRGKNQLMIGMQNGDIQVFKDPKTGEMFTGEFEIKENGETGKLIKLNPYNLNG